MRILNVKQGGNFVEFLVNGEDDAKYLETQLSAAGFQAEIMDQPSGLSETRMQKVMARNKKGETSKSTIDYVRSLDGIEFAP